jgi:hypothetical protein
MTPLSKSVLGTLLMLGLVSSPPRFATAWQEEAAKAGAKATLDEKVAGVIPKASEEPWTTIPWRCDLAAARAEANRVGKPLFVWMMNGNPLGCT